MHTIQYALFLVADVMLIGCPALCFYMCLWRPVDAAILDTTEISRSIPNGVHLLLTYAYFLVTIVSLGLIIYHGISFLFSWAQPFYREQLQTLAAIFAFFAALGLMGALLRVAHKIDDLDRENEGLRYSLNHLQKQIDEVATAATWLSRGHRERKLGDVLDELEKQSAVFQHLPIGVRERFKSDFDTKTKPHNPKMFFPIYLEPSVRFLKLMRTLSDID